MSRFQFNQKQFSGGTNSGENLRVEINGNHLFENFQNPTEERCLRENDNENQLRNIFQGSARVRRSRDENNEQPIKESLILSGDNETNLMVGGRGDDELYGNEGDDIFSVSRGSDSIYGGTGLDIVDYSEFEKFIVVQNAGLIQKVMVKVILLKT